MTGGGLLDFIITLIVVFGTAALFFVAIDRAAPDPLMNKIGKIAVGVLLAVIVLLAVKAVLFGGGGVIATGTGIIGFAIGIIVLFVVLFLLDKVLGAAASWGIPPWIVEIVRYVVFAVALIALLVLADRTFFAGQYTRNLGLDLGRTPSIMRPERR